MGYGEGKAINLKEQGRQVTERGRGSGDGEKAMARLFEEAGKKEITTWSLSNFLT